MTSFTKHGTLQVRPCCCRWHCFICMCVCGIAVEHITCNCIACLQVCDRLCPGPRRHWAFQVADPHSIAIFRLTFHCIHILHILYPFINGLMHLQFSLVAQSCPTLCHPMDCSMPGLPVHHQLPEFTQTQVHWVSDAPWIVWISWLSK